MVLMLHITLRNSMHHNYHLLALSDCLPNKFPACNPIPPSVGLTLSLLLASSEINRCLVDSSSKIWDLSLEIFSLFLLTFLVVIWFLLASSLFLPCLNLVLVWGNCWTHPLRVQIGSGVERTIRKMCSFFRANWCIAVIVSSRVEFW